MEPNYKQEQPRVVFIIGNADRHFHLVENSLRCGANVVGVFSGAKKTNKGLSRKLIRALKSPLTNLSRYFLNLVYRRYIRKLNLEKEREEYRWFGGSRANFLARTNQPFHETVSKRFGSINSDYYLQKISELKPDVIVVFGACLVSKDLISLSDCVINIHTGLSPYYRGGRTNLWPFIYSDFNGFGVTVHRMSVGIDSGDIIFSKKVGWSRGMTYSEVNCLAIKQAEDLVLKSLHLYASGELLALPQWERGRIFNNRDFNGYVCKRYFSILNRAGSQDLPDCRDLVFSEVENGKIVR